MVSVGVYLAKDQVQRFIKKRTVANLPGSDILKFNFRLSPLPEQEKIVSILSGVDEKLDVLEEKKASCRSF